MFIQLSDSEPQNETKLTKILKDVHVFETITDSSFFLFLPPSLFSLFLPPDNLKCTMDSPDNSNRILKENKQRLHSRVKTRRYST